MDEINIVCAPGQTDPFYTQGTCPQDCAGDADCHPDVCVVFNGTCAQCMAACVAGSCHLWETCAADGHCLPTSCQAGYACPPGADCQPASVDADAHGCVLQACSTDAECGCGACVLGLCRTGPGRCEQIKA